MSDEMRNDIIQFIRDEYLEDASQVIDVDTPLISSGIVDSFSMVSLKMFLEKKYKLSIPDAMASPDTFDSVNKIAKLVRELIKG